MNRIEFASLDQLGLVRSLFLEYATSLPFDLGFQDFESEISSLPGKYASPSGFILLAWVDSQLAGCVALRSLDSSTAEIKRLFVRPSFQRFGLGRLLMNRLMSEACLLGYSCLRLDTVPGMEAAQRLYRELGFYPIDAYCVNPVSGAVYFEVELGS